MTVEGRGGPIYSVLSTDTKPTPIEPTALLVETDTQDFFVWDGAVWTNVSSGGGFASTPVHYDAVVDGVGTDTGHFTEVTLAIAAGSINILVLPAPAAGRYAAFTLASTDPVRSIVGIGPNVLVGAVTVDKDEAFMADLETDGRFTVTANTCNFHRIVCRATGNTGFTMGSVFPDVALQNNFVDCAVLEANAGIAFDFGTALHGNKLIRFLVRNFTGTHILQDTQPDGFVEGLNADASNVAPTQEPILVDGTAGGTRFTLVDSNLGCTVPNTFNNINAIEVPFLLLKDTSVSDAVDATPAIRIFHTAAGAINYALEINGGGVTTLFDIPAGSTGKTILQNCRAGPTLVTGTGVHEIRGCVQGAAAVGDRYENYNLLRAVDNTGFIGTIPVAWAQIHGYVHRVLNYEDFRRVVAPGNPPTAGVAQGSREYSRAIDATNDGLFIKMLVAGAIQELQIAPSQDTLGFSGAAAAVVKGTIAYLGFGPGSVSVTEADQEFYLPVGGTVKNLRVFVSASTTTSNAVITIRLNGVNTVLTLTFGAGVTGLLTDLVNSFTVAAGDRIAIQVDNQSAGGGARTITVETVTMELG